MVLSSHIRPFLIHYLKDVLGWRINFVGFLTLLFHVRVSPQSMISQHNISLQHRQHVPNAGATEKFHHGRIEKNERKRSYQYPK